MYLSVSKCEYSVMKECMQDTNIMRTLSIVPPTEMVQSNQQTESKDKSKRLVTSLLLGTSFFTVPLIFGQIFPRLSTFTATHSVGTRDIRRLDTSKREWDTLYLPIRSLIVPPSLFDYLATARLCFLQPYVFPTSHEQSG